MATDDCVEVTDARVEDGAVSVVAAADVAPEVAALEVVEGAVVAAGAAETAGCVVSRSEARSGAAATGAEGAMFASAEDCARGKTALVVLSADVVSGGGACCAASVVDGAGGGGAAVVVCAWAASCAVVVEVNSVEAAAWVEMRVDVAAVRARERVHRLPLTVVVRSCGVAMRKAHA